MIDKLKQLGLDEDNDELIKEMVEANFNDNENMLLGKILIALKGKCNPAWVMYMIRKFKK